MKAPPLPPDEERRIQTLQSLAILDTPAEERFDRVTRLARRLFSVPIALVSLVDRHRQWFKSCQGLGSTETPRQVSFCGHAILHDECFVVEDAERDERFRDNPLVLGEPRIRFYAGYPIRALNGSRLGTLCIIDREPRRLSAEDVASLRDLGQMVEAEIEAIALAIVDTLTGLYNRGGFARVADPALSLCRREKRAACLAALDLNRFKQINDGFGHAEGDRALCEFARLLATSLRQSDLIARLGGDEFCVLFMGSSPEDSQAALRRLRAAVDRRNGAAGASTGYELDYSVGLVPFEPDDHAGVAALLEAADHEMYERKRARVTSSPEA